MSFNSMIVRLKVVASLYTMKVRDKSFNSMIVRLKEEMSQQQNCLFLCFNSMIVRLKGAVASSRLLSASEFQFYDSPIKS